MSRTVRAAVVQVGSFVFDTPRTLEKLAELAARAAGEGGGGRRLSGGVSRRLS